MADANTTRYGFVKPEVGASADTWGAKLNTDMDDIDAIAGAITTTGSANAFVLTTSLSLAAYVAGQSFDIKASFGNTGAATINVDALGAKSLTKNGTTALASGDIVSGNIYRISYDGTQFQIIGGYLSGVFQPLDSDLTAIAALTSAANKFPYSTGAGTWAMGDMPTAMLTFLTTPSSANLAALTSDEAGSGALYFTGGALGTPASGVLTNATGLPISTGVSGLGTGVATFLATPSSANLISAVTDETGSGALVFGTSPTLGGTIGGTPTTSGLWTFGAGLTVSYNSTTAVQFNGTNASIIFDTASATSAYSLTAGLDDTGVYWSTNSASRGYRWRVNGAAGMILSSSSVLSVNGSNVLLASDIGTSVQAYDADLAAVAALTTTAAGRSVLTFTDPNADQIIFWDDSAGSMVGLTLGTGLSITTTTMSLDADLVALAGVTSAADKVPYFTGSGTADVTTVTSAARTVLDDTTVGAMCTTLGAAQLSASNTMTNATPFIFGRSAHDEWRIIQGTASATAGLYLVNQTDTFYAFYATDANNYIGIGTADPICRLDVAGGGMRARIQISSETTGTLTATSANSTVNASGGVTINDGVFTAGDRVEIYAGTSARTITQDTGMTLQLDGTATTGNRTLAAEGRMSIYFSTNAKAICSGAGVT